MSSQFSDGEDKDDEARTLAPDYLDDINQTDAEMLPASKPLPTTIDPHEVWRQLPWLVWQTVGATVDRPLFGIH